MWTSTIIFNRLSIGAVMNRHQHPLRVTVAHELNIDAPASRAFPLACPVRETEWIENWHYHLIFSRSGVNENNCIFWETISFPILFDRSGTICWYTTLYDADARRVEFLLVCENLALIKWEIGFVEKGEDVCRATWNLILTSLGPEVDAIGKTALMERLSGIVGFLGQAMKYYCETGDLFKINQAG